jgi:hypothetical protein
VNDVASASLHAHCAETGLFASMLIDIAHKVIMQNNGYFVCNFILPCGWELALMQPIQQNHQGE